MAQDAGVRVTTITNEPQLVSEEGVQGFEREVSGDTL
jgi:hypothetical protein